ncbi:alpha/beta hydrolase [Brasilonema octagenarum UFV-E1]|uniref:Alpha/beta hydrolase n=2 Tax=Brasilonema TaxID=383614 RepID=A0A856MQY0_9CYAN|nr:MULTISPECIES: alpha/beta hydrolase [Brasilonema]NMF64058.1 alpha/beta hydrolase [Brasilonema octagenarum UFV-OR1]QDL11459.1 alpha/beta hydrolase [Brasilonema sennae CENA114]QDL11466.1 alpha/beta hydrolase [Brasilonema sennae CENA114]QDL17849.1 alpha/beta hydrolase [Brasilonema octagenarum UFV-E1]
MSLQLTVNGSDYPVDKKTEYVDRREVMNQETKQAVADLTKALLSVSTLVNALEDSVRVSTVLNGKFTSELGGFSCSTNSFGIKDLLNKITTRLDMRQLEFCPKILHNMTTFEHVVSNRLALTPDYWSNFQAPMELLSNVDEIVDEVVNHSLESYFKRSEVISFDGALLRAYAGGVANGKVVIIVPPCGMPVELCEYWVHYLSQEHYVITWESRGLFGKTENFDALGYDVFSQAKDLFAVMDYFGIDCSHVMGLCGGAAIALTAASLQPERVSSLSLWHGDFELGDNCQKTRHQKDLQILMSMAGSNRTQAASLQKLFAQPAILENIPMHLAHLILYPYVTGELFFRYGKLNGSIMNADIIPFLNKVLQPTLVVTSKDDTTAHPEGSLFVADKLSNATLHIELHGDHISLFSAESNLTKLATKFIRDEAL